MESVSMEISPITLSVATSAFIAAIAAFTLLYDWYANREPPRLEWGIGMLFYSLGYFFASLMYATAESSILSFLIYVNLSGVSMGLLLYGTLLLFDPSRIRARLVSFGYGSLFLIGTLFFGLIVTTSFPVNPILIQYGEITNHSMVSWFTIEMIIPVSFLIAFLMFIDLKQTKNISSFWISLSFFLYALLLFIWPVDDETLRFFFYVGRAISTACIFAGVRELSRKKVYTQLIREAKAESAFLLDILSHDIKGCVHGSQMLLESQTIDKVSRKMIQNNLTEINSLVERVGRYRAIDKFQERALSPLDLVEIIEKNIEGVRHSFPQNPIDYKIHLDESVANFEILGNEFLNDLFLNIFHNAVKHHRNSPEVQFNIFITNVASKACWKIEIQDDGPGIPENLVESLFSISEDESPSTEKGIGHLIIRNTVRWYGGKVWAENRMKNGRIEGATILVKLPKLLNAEKSD